MEAWSIVTSRALRPVSGRVKTGAWVSACPLCLAATGHDLLLSLVGWHWHCPPPPQPSHCWQTQWRGVDGKNHITSSRIWAPGPDHLDSLLPRYLGV